MKQIYIETFGCQMNVADSDLIAGVMAREGYTAVPSPEGADVVLVNTCAIRDNAEQRVYGRVGELKRHKRPGSVLGVVGCMAQRLGPTLLDRVPHVDLVAGPDGYRALPGLIARAAEGERGADVTFKSWEHYEDVPPDPVPGQASRFVTVQRGCDHRCTFCIVPMTRGPERSRTLDDVVREISHLAQGGVTEVTLLGQTVNSYHDGVHDFADLLGAVGAVDGIRRVRFTSPHPNDFSDRVIAAMVEVPEVCEHVHLPVQSGSSRVLKRMLRRYTRAEYLACVERLRAAVPNLSLTTDIIVGFPGETESDFEETLSLVREVGFDDALTFRYAVRAGTPAVKIRDHLDPAVSGARLERLIAVVREVARGRNAARVGAVEEVLVEKPARRGGLLQTRTRSNRVVLIDAETAARGDYLTVRLTGTTGSTFTGVPVSAAPRRRELVVMG